VNHSEHGPGAVASPVSIAVDVDPHRFPPRSFGLFPPILYPIGQQAWEEQAGPRQILGVAQMAEDLGYAFVTCGDHGVLSSNDLPSYGSARFYDAVATLSYLAAGTNAIGLATLVYQAPLRSPLITAKTLATLDHLSGGRLIAGFGVGSRRQEAESAGIDFDRRGSIADDYIRAVAVLWRDEVASYDGPYARFHEVMCDPRPVQQPRPPIWIGGNRAVGLRRAVRLGDAWAPFWVPLADVTAVLDRASQGPQWAARPSHFRLIMPVAPLGGRAPRGEPPAPFATPGPAALRKCLGDIEQWQAVGATDFIVDLPAPTAMAFEEGLAWFATEVAPEAGLVSASSRRPSR
jgi:probable F420-dependent oxidoreductase